MKLTELKGIGEKSKNALFQKGIFSCEDLAKFLPSSYREISVPQEFASNKKGITISVCLLEEPKTNHIKKLSITRAKAQDLLSNRVITLVWFNQPFAAKAYKKDQKYIAFGTSRQNDFHVSLLSKAEKSDEIIGQYAIYKKTGIKRSVLQNAIIQSIKSVKMASFLPISVEKKYNLKNLSDSYLQLHTSKSTQEIQQALKRIELEKAILFLQNEGEFCVQKNRERVLNLNTKNEISLPFVLTDDQQKAVEEIKADLKKSESMNRLIMGEVGSGKTMVAFIASIYFLQAGYQVAFLAPTEILAQQHKASFDKYFSTLFKSVLLTSTTPNKNEILKDVQNGQAKMIFGTHILSQSANFSNLGLVVIDEQQRFGVETRANLIAKSVTGDTLSLSATPIPRSVLLSLSGTLKTTKIKNRPFEQNIKTHFVSPQRQPDMWDYLKNQSKLFVICPKIEEEDSDIFESNSTKSTQEIQKELGQIFGVQNVLRVDGSFSHEKQNQIMQKFIFSTAKVLVATTVVEVGVDIKDVSNIVIFNPERFGLSSLHQLRGRVGRDGKESHCFLLEGENISKEAKERLNFFKNHNNGFEIADYDFKSRGAGDAFGTKQSGEYVLPFSAETLNFAKAILKDTKAQKRVLIAPN